MNDATDTKKQKESLQGSCECAKRETTWVLAQKYVPTPEPGHPSLRTLRRGWQCLNCGKFRPDDD